MVKKRIFAVLVIILSTFLFYLLMDGTAFSANIVHNSGIVIENERMSANLKNIPLSEIYQIIKKKCNIQIKGGEEFQGKKITINFKGLTIDRGISRLLSGLNYSILYDSNGSLREIIIAGESNKPQQLNRYSNSPQIAINNPETEKAGASLNNNSDGVERQETFNPVSSAIPVDVSRIKKQPININRNNPGISSLLKKDDSD